MIEFEDAHSLDTVDLFLGEANLPWRGCKDLAALKGESKSMLSVQTFLRIGAP